MAGKEVNAEIKEDIQDILVKSIQKKGITEGFILKFDENDNYSDFIDEKISPEKIRHVSGKSEKSFNSEIGVPLSGVKGPFTCGSKSERFISIN